MTLVRFFKVYFKTVLNFKWDRINEIGVPSPQIELIKVWQTISIATIRSGYCYKNMIYLKWLHETLYKVLFAVWMHNFNLRMHFWIHHGTLLWGDPWWTNWWQSQGLVKSCNDDEKRTFLSFWKRKKIDL